MVLDRPLVALAAFALAALALLVLDRLRRRPVIFVVASLDLFPDSAETESARSRSNRRAWRDLVLKALAAASFALALGGPKVPGAQLASRHVRIVLARGASLAAREPGGTTRLELAKLEARRVIDLLSPGDRVDLRLAPSGRDDPAPSLSRDEALAALARAPAVAAPSGLEARLQALAASARSERATDPAALPVFAVSDRPLERGALPRELEESVSLATVGTPLPNLAIVALASSSELEGREGNETRERLLVAVRNASNAPARAKVRLRFARGVDEKGELSGPTGEIERTLDPGPDETRTFLVPEREGGESPLAGSNAVLATIEGGDPLALDDRVLALRRTEGLVRVAIGGDLGRPLETALRSVPGTTVTLLPPGDIASVASSASDLTIARWERDDAPSPPGAVVWVCPPRSPAEEKPVAHPFREGPRKPLVKDADLLHGIAGVEKARRELPRNVGELETVLEDADGTQLIAAGPASGKRLVVVLGFALPAKTTGTWAGEPSFPRFWADLVEHVRERGEQPRAFAVARTGEALLLPRPLEALPDDPLSVRRGTEPPFAAPGERYVPLESGAYRVSTPGKPGEAIFSAALLDPATSDLRGARPESFPGSALALLSAPRPRAEPFSLAGIVAVLGLALAALAWWLDRTPGVATTASLDSRARAAK